MVVPWLLEVQACVIMTLNASFFGKGIFFVGLLRDLHALILPDYFEKWLLILINGGVLLSIGILQHRFVIIQVAKSFVCTTRNQRILHGLILSVQLDFLSHRLSPILRSNN